MRLKYRLKNFKAFRDTGTIEMAPITVLCGANSSGKTSILKSMLLIKQSSERNRSLLLRGGSLQPLLFNGEMARLGAWTDVVHGKERENQIMFEWQVTGDWDELSRRSMESYAIGSGRRHPRASGRFDFTIHVSFKSQGNDPIEFATYVSEFGVVDRLHDVTFTLKSRDLIGYYTLEVSDLSKFLEADYPTYWIYAPTEINSVISVFRSVENASMPLGTFHVDFGSPFPTDFSLTPQLQQWYGVFRHITEQVPRSRTRGNAYKKFLSQLPLIQAGGPPRTEARSRQSSLVENVALHMIRILERKVTLAVEALLASSFNLRYLGPLREQPRRFYEFDDTGGVEMGLSGEFAVQVLSLERNKIIDFSRVIDSENGPLEICDQERAPLISALNYWLPRMGLPTVSPEILRQSLYALSVDASEKLHLALPDVGFGVSQVLPIVLECLRAEPGDTVILEQPEIHLHPRIQSVLGDFFLSRARDGVRFLIESHSEYLVKRLCRRIAEDREGAFRKLINILFVRATSFDESECTPIELNEFGEIVNWPEGFFDRTDDLPWVNASLKRRQEKR